MKLTKNKFFWQQKITKGTFTPNYSRFYVKDQQELHPFYM